jgi:hypothetical protein
METFLAFARGFAFREKAQSYHNPILSNVRRLVSALFAPAELREMHACQLDGRPGANMLKGAVSRRGVLGSGTSIGGRPAGRKN